MFLKTSTHLFQKYGEVYNELPKEQIDVSQNHSLHIQNDFFEFFYQSNEDLYLKTTEGIVLLVISEDLKKEKYDEFVIHRIVKIKKGNYFNFISLTQKSTLTLYYDDNNTKLNHYFIPCIYQHKRIISSIKVNEIIAYYYNVRNINYFFPEEKHAHWELTLVDHGTLETQIDQQSFLLKEQQLLLYAPNQSHTQKTNKKITCSYLTILFDMEIEEKITHSLQNKIFYLSKEIQNNIHLFIKESENLNAFSNDILIQYIQEIILQLLKNPEETQNINLHRPSQQKFEDELLSAILNYVNENICTPLTIEEICIHFSMSRSSLQTLFKNNLNTAPKQYITKLKLQKSKILIKENTHTISEIANILGFSSIHYFSRKFKQQFQLSPSEYAKTLYN